MKKTLLRFEDLKPNQTYYNVQRNKYNGKIRNIKCYSNELNLTNGGKKKILYGIWTNNNDYENLGYVKPIKSKTTSRYKRKSY